MLLKHIFSQKMIWKSDCLEKWVDSPDYQKKMEINFLD